jgi:hypothetical protein
MVFNQFSSNTVLGGDFWHILIDVPGDFLNDFSWQTTSGHAYT